jgi:dihydropteroate synthase
MKSTRQNTAFSTNKTLNVQGRLLDLSTPVVMGILNITPDSFYENSRVVSESDILKKAAQMLEAGALILDVGSYSSRPGADDVPEYDELKRSVNAITSIRKEFPTAIISVDTFRSRVASEAVQHGANMVNDISGGELDEDMFATVASLHVPYILMHMKGTPKTMSSLSSYDNLFTAINHYFSDKIHKLTRMGVNDILIDPGFGFAKTIEQNYEMLQHLNHFNIHHKPILVGLSRKSMIWKTLQITPDLALPGTAALHMVALSKGATILRAHDVKEASDVIKLHQQLNK